MTVKDLIEELKHYEENATVKMHIQVYSKKDGKEVEEIFADISKLTFQRYLTEKDFDTLNIDIVLRIYDN